MLARAVSVPSSVLGLGRLEGRDAGRDRLGAGERDRAGGERAEHDQDRHVLRRLGRGGDDLGHGRGPVSPWNTIRNVPAAIIRNAEPRNR